MLVNLNLVPAFVRVVKVINSGEITRAIVLKGLLVTEPALQSIQSLGGKVEE